MNHLNRVCEAPFGLISRQDENRQAAAQHGLRWGPSSRNHSGLFLSSSALISLSAVALLSFMPVIHFLQVSVLGPSYFISPSLSFYPSCQVPGSPFKTLWSDMQRYVKGRNLQFNWSPVMFLKMMLELHFFQSAGVGLWLTTFWNVTLWAEDGRAPFNLIPLPLFKWPLTNSCDSAIGVCSTTQCQRESSNDIWCPSATPSFLLTLSIPHQVGNVFARNCTFLLKRLAASDKTTFQLMYYWQGSWVICVARHSLIV